jgi:hypothetical protein
MTSGQTITVGPWFQGPTDSGQGGWTAHRLASAIDEPVTVAIKRPIPLEVDLTMTPVDNGWHLVDPNEPDQPVLVATPWTPDYADTEPVSLADAADARTRFPLHDDHPVPVCFSCGANPDSMQVHSGPLAGGRWATDWTVPEWAVDADGVVDEGALWAAIDCAQAWYAGNAGGRRHAVTVQLAVEVLAPLEAGATYALVAWNGTYPESWDGRKRGAGGAVFANDGTCVARSSSFWIAI